MKKKKSSKASLGDIAKAASVSKMTVSYALRNYSSISLETRHRVQRIAQQMGYFPYARMGLKMAKVRGAKAKDLLPIAWLNTQLEKDAWTKHKYLSPYREGAQECCGRLGYRLEDIWTHEPGMTMQRISQILYQRGLNGVIVTYPAAHIRLRWNDLAGVSFGGALLAPRLHRVTVDSYFNLTLAIKILRRYGYRRIGICLSEHVDRVSQRMHRITTYHLVGTSPVSNRIPPLYYWGEDERSGVFTDKQLPAWVRRYRPEVIVSANGQMVGWINRLGLRVPEDIGVIHLSLDDDVLNWAGIHSNKKEVGRVAAEWVISMVQNHRFGVPLTPLTTLVRGSWHPGQTLLVPNPKAPVPSIRALVPK